MFVICGEDETRVFSADFEHRGLGTEGWDGRVYFPMFGICGEDETGVFSADFEHRGLGDGGMGCPGLIPDVRNLRRG